MYPFCHHPIILHVANGKGRRFFWIVLKNSRDFFEPYMIQQKLFSWDEFDIYSQKIISAVLRRWKNQKDRRIYGEMHVHLKSISYLMHFLACLHSFCTYFLCQFQLHLLHYCPPTFLLAYSWPLFLNAIHTFSSFMSSLNRS